MSDTEEHLIQLDPAITGLDGDDEEEAALPLSRQLARLAAIRGTPEDFAAVADLLDEHRRTLERGLPVTEHAARFHVLVAYASHNRIAAAFMESILGLLRARGRKTDGDRTYAAVELAEHAAVLEVLRTRDGDRAAEAMLEHILRSAATYDLDEGGTIA